MVRRTNFPGILVPRTEIFAGPKFPWQYSNRLQMKRLLSLNHACIRFHVGEESTSKGDLYANWWAWFYIFSPHAKCMVSLPSLAPPPLYKIPIPMPLVTLTQTARSYVLLCHRSVSIVSLWLYCHRCSGSSQPVAVITCFSVAIATAFPFNIGLLYLCNSFLATSIPCIPTDMGGRKFQLDMHCKRREEIWWMKCYLTP